MDKIVHGLDLSDEITEKNTRILIEMLNIPPEELEKDPDED